MSNVSALYSHCHTPAQFCFQWLRMCVFPCVHMCVCMNVCMFAYVHEYMYVCMYLCLYVCLHMHLCEYYFSSNPPQGLYFRKSENFYL